LNKTTALTNEKKTSQQPKKGSHQQAFGSMAGEVVN